jgi:hypothetical protein
MPTGEVAELGRQWPSGFASVLAQPDGQCFEIFFGCNPLEGKKVLDARGRDACQFRIADVESPFWLSQQLGKLLALAVPAWSAECPQPNGALTTIRASVQHYRRIIAADAAQSHGSCEAKIQRTRVT